MGMSGMGSHQSARMQKDEWLTPPEIIKALGPFGLDPCAPINRPWPTAAMHFSVENDGLSQDWRQYEGMVWMNPPYGKHTGDWLEKLADHGNGIALVFARVETEDWHTHIWPKANAVFFPEGRLFFHHVSGKRARFNGGAPSAFVAYGMLAADRLKRLTIPGKFISL
jgi:hypothetical protein